MSPSSRPPIGKLLWLAVLIGATLAIGVSVLRGELMSFRAIGANPGSGNTASPPPQVAQPR